MDERGIPRPSDGAAGHHPAIRRDLAMADKNGNLFVVPALLVVLTILVDAAPILGELMVR